MIGNLSSIAGSLAFLASLAGIGLAVGRWLGIGQTGERQNDDSSAAWPSLGWAFLVGAAVVGLTLQIPLAIDGRISHRSFAAVGIAGIAALVWSIVSRVRSGGRKISFGWLGDLPLPVWLLAISTVAAAFLYCCRTDLTGYDARSIYALKARVLYDTGTIRGEDFQDIERVHFNPSYPLSLPLLEAQCYWSQGSYTAPGLKLLFLAFSLSLVSIFVGELSNRRGSPCAVGSTPHPSSASSPQARPLSLKGRGENEFAAPLGRGAAAVLALMILLTPICLECFEGAALSGSADFPLGVLLLAAVLEVSRWIRQPGFRPAIGAAILFGAAACTKAEGMSWIAACCLGMAGAWLLRRTWPTRRQLATAMAGFGVLLIALVVRQSIGRQFPTSPYYLSYGGALSWTWIRQLGDRPIVIIRYATTELGRAKFWNLAWPCLLASFVLLRRGCVPTAVWFWRMTLVAGFGASLFALLITPFHLQYELRTSMTRLMLQGFPLAALIMAEQMTASGWIGQIAATMRLEKNTDQIENVPRNPPNDAARAA